MVEIQVPESPDELERMLNDLDAVGIYIKGSQLVGSVRDYILEAIQEGVGQITTKQNLIDHDFALAIKAGTT